MGPRGLGQRGATDRWYFGLDNSGRWGPYRQASPPPARHRPGARSARREVRRHSIADHNAKETIMWFNTFLKTLKSRPPAAVRRSSRPPTGCLKVETLEERAVLSAVRPNIVFIMSDDQDVETMRYMPRVQELLAAQG